jgi:hypothetical protein
MRRIALRTLKLEMSEGCRQRKRLRAMYLAVGCPFFLDFYMSLAVFIKELQISLQ